MRFFKHWLSLSLVVIGSFVVLGYYGYDIYQQAPPIPERVVDEQGTVLLTGKDILDGQNVWQSFGGQELGSVWGHGAYVAPDWSADWLHRELTFMLDELSQKEHGKPFAELDLPTQAAIQAKMKNEIRTNTYNAETKTLQVSDERARAIASVGDHYARLFGDDPEMAELRNAYAMPANTLKDCHPTPRAGHYIHQQLAIREPDRQPSDRSDSHLVGHQLRYSSGGDRRIGLAACCS